MEDPCIFDPSDETIFFETAPEFSLAANFGPVREGIISIGNLGPSNFGASIPPQKTSSTVCPVALNQPTEFHQKEGTCIANTGASFEPFNRRSHPPQSAASVGETKDNIQKRPYEDEEDSIGFYDYNLIVDEQEGDLNEEVDETSPQQSSPPDSKPPRKRQRITEEEWEKYRPVIKRLYIVENKSLAEVMESMNKRFQFNPP